MKDITKLIYSGLEGYPGDPPVCFEQCSFVCNDGFGLYEIKISNHTGTHIDFPSHVIENGKNSNHYDISYLCGKGIIIDLTNCEATEITIKNFINQDIRENDIVLLKYGKRARERNEFPALQSDAVNFLIDKKVKIIGTESLSIDSETNTDLKLHKKFLMNEILILECLEINEIEAGRVSVFVFPLKLDSLDGLPCRVCIEYE